MKLNKISVILFSFYLIATLPSMASNLNTDDVKDNDQFPLSVMTQLHYASFDIDDEEAKIIAIGLKYNKIINYIDLNHNQITKTGIKDLSRSLIGKPITQFHIHGSKIGDEGHIALAEAVKTWTGLTHLNVNMTDLGDIGANALCEALRDKKIQIFHFNNGHKMSLEGKRNFLKKLAGIPQI